MRLRRCVSTPCAHAQRGAMLIEVLVALVLCAFGMLGYVAVQARASTAEYESMQRGNALHLLEDMASRINANRANAGDYVVGGLVGAGPLEDCAGLAGAERDLCQWANLLRGESESRSGSLIGSMEAARGCITRAAGSTDRFVISIAWLGNSPTGAPAAPCGADDPALADGRLRRAVSTTLCIAALRDPDPAAPPRC
jgi:type IV pilus assembly protein PilV